MKRGLYYLLFFVITTTFCFASVPYHIRIQAEQQKNKQINNTSIAYQIRTEGQRLPDGSYTPDKIYNIERVSPEHYLPNMIHVKTRSYYKLGKGEKILGSLSLQTALSELKVINLRAPFAKKAENSIQSADEENISRIYEVYYESNVDPYEACMELMKNPDVEYAVPIFKRYLCLKPNDTRYNQQWGLPKIGLEAAWAFSQGDPNVVIGIVDTGVDWIHEDLNANIYINPGEDGLDGNGQSKRTNNIDDDGNGKIDDWHGWDFVGNITWNEYVQGIFKADNDAINIGNNHGTHVAGDASAVTNNGVGVAGPGFKCKILPIKCSPDNPGVTANILTGYEGIKYAADMGCKVINCSWGGPVSSPVEQEIINYAYNKGVVVVVAAGNDYGFNIDQGGQYPAANENVLCVGSSNQNEKVSGFSNIGRRVNVYSPGSSIMATLPNNSYGSLDGTSMASPITAGVSALVVSAHPTWTPKQIIHQIRSTSDNVLTADPNLRSYYYGRINALNALQFNNGGSQNIPGVEVETYSIEGKSALIDGTITQVNLKVTNFLSPANRLNLKITSLSSFLTIENDQITIGTLGNLESTNKALQVQLQPNNPWYNGTADLLLTFQADNYTDYQIIRLPININSNNQYTRVNYFSDEQRPYWSDAMATSETNVWAIGGLYGNVGGYLKRTNSGTTIITLNFQADTVYTVFAFDERRVYLGSGNDKGQAKIFSTQYENGGQTSWDAMDVSTITSFVNGIHFFDNNNGIFLGDPKNNKFGIGVTSNGGQNWTQINAPPVPLSQETGLVGSIYWHGDNCWFGTTKGRVFRTTNRGISWSSGAINKALNIYSLAFKDDYNGIAVYSESTQPDADRLIASTTDRGATWIGNKYNMTQNGHLPVHAFYPDSSSMIYILCSMGEVQGTSNQGTSWYPVLSEKEARMYVGSHVSIGQNRARLWEIGKTVGFLDFGYIPMNANRDLELTSGNTLNFDTVKIGSSKIQNVEIKNNGNVDVNIFSVFFNYPAGVDSSEFTFFGTPPSYISPDALKKIKIRFIPSKIGLRTAGLYIKSDGSPDEFSIVLTGFAKDTTNTAVDDFNYKNNFLIESINPNPASVQAFLGFTLPNDGNIQISVFNSLGIETKKIFNGIATSGENVIPINVEDFSSGVYYIRMKFGERTINRKFVVSR